MTSSPPRYEVLKDSYRELQSQMESKFLHSAIEQVLAFLKYNPGHAAAHNDLGLFYYRQGDKLQALGHFQKAIRLAPENSTFRKNIANFFLKEMEWVDEAVSLYQEVLAAAPGDIDALVALATISSHQGDPAQARLYMDQILSQQAGPAPDSAPCQTGREEHATWMPAGAKSQEPPPQVLREQPDSGCTRQKSGAECYLEARSLSEQGKSGDAIAMLEKLLAVDPGHALAHNDLAVLYQVRGDCARALAHQKKASVLEPGNALFTKNLAGLYLEQADTDAAIFTLLDQLKRHPDDIEVIIALGNISLSIDRPQEAKIFFERALALEPWNQVARDAVVALAQPAPDLLPTPERADAATAPTPPQPQQATASLDELLAKLRNSAPPVAPVEVKASLEALYRQAQQAAAAGDLEQATEQFETLTACHPEFAAAYNDLGVLYFQQDDFERSLERHRKAVALAPDNLDFNKNLAGLCLIDPSTRDEGIMALTSMIKLYPADTETLFGLGRVCLEVGRPAEARVFLGKLLDLEPWNREAQALLQQIETQQ